MYRIIIVDDEPLILTGISSLLNWEDYDCTIVGKATNGLIAFDLIKELKPDIVITDIRMPVLNGLELIEKCNYAGFTFASIVLTNLEEFQLAKKALTLGASDYLIKLDLTAEELIGALTHAQKNCDLLIRKEMHPQSPLLRETQLWHDYFTQLLVLRQKEAVPPKKDPDTYAFPVPILFSLHHINIEFMADNEKTDISQISSQIGDIVSGIASRLFPAHTLLNYRQNIYLLVCALSTQQQENNYKHIMETFCHKLNTAFKTYFELTAAFGIGSPPGTLECLTESLHQAGIALDYYYYDSHSNVVFYQNQIIHKSNANAFNINFLKKDLAASVQQNDSLQLQHIFEQIIDLFTLCKPNKEHALSACINIYIYLYSFFETESNNYLDVFPYSINIVDYLNQLSSLSDILKWLDCFCGKLCKLLNDRRENPSDKLVEKAKRYVMNHYQEKLALAEVAHALNISAGHLSITFKKYTGETLSDYIAKVKIDHAKELIRTQQYLMYEIADLLGFENAYYFSKVFKKVTGLSPRDYEKNSTA